MKISLPCSLFVLGVLFSPVWGCSSSSEGDDDINANNNATNSENEDLKNNKNNNLGENINNSTKNEFVNNQGDMGKVGNAPPPMNNATNSLLTNDAGLNAPAGNVPPANMPAGAPTNAAATPAAPIGPPVTGFGPDGRGKVRYVRRPTQKYSQPGQGPAGSLDTGDHPLVVKEQGQWNQLSNGTFIDQQELSDEGIGRPRKTRTWQ